MKAAIFAYSRRGCQTARNLMAAFPDSSWQAYTMERFAEPGFAPIAKPVYADSFSRLDALFFVGSCGIAVREIAPYVKDKRTDPAVLCIDELGTFVIPLLSGHIGGANALARKTAECLHATPVITTATDINRKFSVDTWAAENGCAISSMRDAKAVSAAILESDIPLTSDFPIATGLPSGIRPGDSGELGIFLTCSTNQPFTRTLRLIPRIVHLGIGCRRGISSSAIREAVAQVLEENKIDNRAIKCVASIDLKAEEAGLLDFCSESHLPVTFYSAEALGQVEGEFTPSEFVRSVTGVDNVCERAALMGAEKLIVNKTACHGVTVAAAAEHWEVHFG